MHTTHPSPPGPSIWSCAWHPTYRAEVSCDRCLRSCCEGCAVRIEGEDWCLDCSLVAAGVRVRSLRSRAALRRYTRIRRSFTPQRRAIA